MVSTTPKIKPGEVPAGYKAHTESSTTILVPDSNTAFLNPVQQYNRDLSIAVIRSWNELRIEEAIAKQENKKGKGKGKGKKDVVTEEQPEAGPSKPYAPRKITILEALSATGLRSIRYAKEIPNVRTVLANDISHSACEAMRMNVDYNDAGPSAPVETAAESTEAEEPVVPVAELSPEEQAMNVEEGVKGTGEPSRRRPGCEGYVTVNENDACMLMYEHRHPAKRVEVVDLDPYGTAAPFIDGAVQCVTDGGLLAVTCTDLAVLAGHQYPEKCYSNYGGASVNTSWSHEAALRLVLGSISNAAARYGRYITPLVSFSIDFYVRVFVRVDTQATQVKRLASRMGVVYCCHFCHSYHTQPFGRVVEKEAPNGNVNVSFKTAPGPPVNGSSCEECGSTLHLGGPMWLAPIHDVGFVNRTLKSIEGSEKDYGTWPRINGMLTLAANEIEDPFYLTANKMFGTIHASSAPTTKVLSALLNGGYNFSRSHASPGSIKTNAPCSFMYDIVREHVKENPVRMDKIPEKSPSRFALLKAMTHKIDFTPHPDVKNYERSDKVVFYQTNPQANWGPASRARNVPAGASEKVEKRKSESVDEEASKKVKKDDGEEEGLNA